jgi:hypothetical protein
MLCRQVYKIRENHVNEGLPVNFEHLAGYFAWVLSYYVNVAYFFLNAYRQVDRVLWLFQVLSLNFYLIQLEGTRDCIH